MRSEVSKTRSHFPPSSRPAGATFICWALLSGAALLFCPPSASAAGRHEPPAPRPHNESPEAEPYFLGDSLPRPFQVLSLFDPFAERSLLVSPDNPPSLTIRAKYPRLDGSTSLFPVYAAAFKAIYAPPGKEEGEAGLADYQGSITCSSSRGFDSFLKGERDIFFGFEPSEEFKRLAEQSGVRLRLTPLGKDGFVFCVNADNPVNGLSLDEVRGIYSGAVTNWKELGGPDKTILPYQRVNSSGSQTALERHVMKDRPLMRPAFESIAAMRDLLDNVAAIHANAMPIGYSFRWYVRKMAGVPGIKLLALDGVPPLGENIASERYPLVLPFFAIVREGDVSPETQQLLDWFSGPEGQALIEKTGYLPVGPHARSQDIFRTPEEK